MYIVFVMIDHEQVHECKPYHYTTINVRKPIGFVGELQLGLCVVRFRIEWRAIYI